MTDGEQLGRGIHVTRLLLALRDPACRTALADDPDGLMDRFGLSPVERGWLRARDWQALLVHGVSIYAIAKGSRALGQTLIDVGAAMRGESADALLARLPIHPENDPSPPSVPATSVSPPPVPTVDTGHGHHG